MSSTSDPTVPITVDIPPLPTLPEFIAKVNLANSASALLRSIYSAFETLNGSFVWSDTGTGTYTMGSTVHLDPEFLPDSNSQYSHTLVQLAAALGHEIEQAGRCWTSA
jgi:hypothetical protein